jgi:hypothetical protein
MDGRDPDLTFELAQQAADALYGLGLDRRGFLKTWAEASSSASSPARPRRAAGAGRGVPSPGISPPGCTSPRMGG